MRIQDLREAEEELIAYYTSALGVAAQHYDQNGSGGTFDSDTAVARLVFELRSQLRNHSAIEGTIAVLAARDQRLLPLAYYPRWMGMRAMQTYLSAHPPTAQLVPYTPAARRAYERWCEKRRRPVAVDLDRTVEPIIRWLDDEATRADCETTFGPLREAAEEMLLEPLTAYDQARLARLKRAASAKLEADRARERDLDARLGGR